MAEIMEFAGIYLAVFYSSVAAFYTTRIFTMKRSTSKELVFPGDRFCKTWWNHVTFRVFRVTIWMVCVFRVFFPMLDSYLGMFNSLLIPEVIITGLGLLTFGFVATVAVHYQLGRHWRSGIDPRGPNKIITNGLFAYSRNPMFCFVALAQLGFFLSLPSAFSLICLMVGLYTLNSQARAEERHLLEVFPAEYSHYSNNVRRWV